MNRTLSSCISYVAQHDNSFPIGYKVTRRGSTLFHTDSGVPQDSVLGPDLFSLYTYFHNEIISSHGFSYHSYTHTLLPFLRQSHFFTDPSMHLSITHVSLISRSSAATQGILLLSLIWSLSCVTSVVKQAHINSCEFCSVSYISHNFMRSFRHLKFCLLSSERSVQALFCFQICDGAGALQTISERKSHFSSKGFRHILHITHF